MKRNFTWRDERGFGPLAIIIIIAIIAVVGGGIYYAKEHSPAYVEENSETSATADVSTGGNTFRDLLAIGRNVMCTFSSAEANGSMTGTVYISGPTMRGDFTGTSQSNGSVESHMIRNGDLVYTWSGNQGAKMAFNNLATPSTEAKSTVSLDQKVDYKCSDWTPDSSKFTVPTTVTFTDISAMMQDHMTGDHMEATSGASAGAGASMGGSQCGICASLSGTAKTQCMSAYHCTQ